jgi:hypothetical protein
MKKIMIALAAIVLALVSPVLAEEVDNFDQITSLAQADALAYYRAYPSKHLDIVHAMQLGLAYALKTRNLIGSDATHYECNFGQALSALYENQDGE